MFVYGSLLLESWPDGLACPAVISRMLMCVILLITEPRLYKSCHCHLKEVQLCDRSRIKNLYFERFNTVVIEERYSTVIVEILFLFFGLYRWNIFQFKKMQTTIMVHVVLTLG